MKNKVILRFIIPPALIIAFAIYVIISLSTKNSSPPPPSGWILQTNLQSQLRGRVVNDMTFIDSVTGFAVTNALSQTDTCFIFKTTNGGDNWFLNYWTNEQFANAFRRIKFITNDIGFVCGGGGYALICKTTDRGNTWTKINFSSVLSFLEMSVLNKDTLYVVNDDGLTGGIFRSVNGGLNFTNINSWRATNIYMYNSMTGFISSYYGLGKTTNGGFNWTLVNNKGFTDIHFLDTLFGYRISPDSTGYGSIQKTTNGGHNWIIQSTPIVPGVPTAKEIIKFCFLGRDTIWAVGSYVEYLNPIRRRGIIYKTTNGGLNWGYQLPDTHSVQVSRYDLVNFVGNKYGWIYDGHYLPGQGMGIHTFVGGDSTIYTIINNNITSVSDEYILYQNYPNPFNSVSNIKYKIENTKIVKLIVFDIRGIEITTLVNKKQNTGEYKVKFDASKLSSGIYFYSLFIEEIRIDTKKMIIIK